MNEMDLFEMAGTKKEEVKVGDRTVVYITDANRKRYLDNNVFILDAEKNIVWDMSRVLKRPDTAVLMKVESGIMHFTTFNGLHFGIDVATLDVVKKQITK